MTTFAGRPVFPGFFVDTSGRPKPNLAVTVYERGKGPSPGGDGTLVMPVLYTDRTKSTVAANPTTTDSLGNLWVYLDPGDYDVVSNGVIVPFSVLPEIGDVPAPIPPGTYAQMAKEPIKVQEAPYSVIADGVYRAAATTQMQAALDLADSSGRPVDLGHGQAIVVDTLNYRLQPIVSHGARLQGRPGKDVLHADNTLSKYARQNRPLPLFTDVEIVVDDSVDAAADFPSRNDGNGNTPGNAGLAFDFPDGLVSTLRSNNCDFGSVMFRSLSLVAKNNSCGLYAQVQPNLTKFPRVFFYRLAYGWWDDYPRTNLASVEHFSDHNSLEHVYFNGCGKSMRRVNTDSEKWGTVVIHGGAQSTDGAIWLGRPSLQRATCGRTHIASFYIEDITGTPVDFGGANDMKIESWVIQGPHGTVVMSCNSSDIRCRISTLGGTNTPPVLSVTGNRNESIEVALANTAAVSDYGARSLVSDSGAGNRVLVMRFTDGSGPRCRKPEVIGHDGRVLHQRDATALLMGHVTAPFVSGDDLLVSPQSIVPINSTEGVGHTWDRDVTTDLGTRLRILAATGFFSAETVNINGQNGFRTPEFLPATQMRVYVKAKVATAGTQVWTLKADGVTKGSGTLTWTTSYAVQSFNVDLTGVGSTAVLQLATQNLAGGGAGPLDIAWVGFRPYLADLLVASTGAAASRASLGAAAIPASEWIAAPDLHTQTGVPSLLMVGGANNGTPGWLMDAATHEAVAGSMVVPEGWATVNVVLLWANAGGGAGDVVWRSDLLMLTVGSTLNAGGAGPNVTATAGTQDILMSTTLRSGFAVTAGGIFHVDVMRLGADAADTLANDAGIIGLLIQRAS